MMINKKKFEDAVKLVSPFMTQNGKGKELAQISKAFEAAQTNPVCILVCGEFKRGKSTFVNALIGRNLCATDTDICTSVVSVIKYGEKEKVVRYYGDFSDPKTQEISLDDLEQYTVGTAEEIDNTISVEISLPLPILKEGLVIIDTPGVGGLDPRHATLTNFFMPKADIALFVTDVNEPVTTTELAFYKNKVLPYAKQTAIIVNKADLREDGDVEDFRNDTINKIASSAQIKEEEVVAISVSSAAEAFPDLDLGESNFDLLREVISELVKKHRDEISVAMVTNFLELLDLSITPLQAQLQQIEQPDVNQIDKLNKEKSELDKKLAQLVDPNSDFRLTIAKIISSKREEIQNFINEASVTLQSETFNSLIHSPQSKASDGGKWMGMMLNDAIAEIGSEVTMRLDKAFSQIAALPQFEGLLQFETKDYTGHIVIRDVDTSVPMNKRITPLMSGAGIITLGSYLATGVFGIVAAIGIGAYVAYKNQKDSSNIHIESNLRQVYQPQMSGAISSLNTYVNARFTDFQQEFLSIITERCKAYKDSVQTAIANIQQVKQAINQAVSMKVQIQNKLKPLIVAKEMIIKPTT